LIEKRAIELARDHYAPDATFCVRVNRAEKRFPINSAELERRLGAGIIQNTPWDKVKLKDSDVIFYVNIKPEGVFLHTSKRQGMGGLPVGISGHVLTLLSGGIDSPVAAYLVAKRGCSMDFLHFTANSPQQNQAEDDKVGNLVQKLSKTTMRSRLYLVPASYFQVAILGRQLDYELVIFRRFMTRVAEQLARQHSAQALVVGDSLGQVASQTLDNIVACTQAVTLPILHPLLAYDKQDIIEFAKHIGTYQISVKPYKDCCSILARDPRARSNVESISRLEQAVLPEYDALTDRTLKDVVCLEYEWGRRVS
jgi:thiamine biosynthesis protein ThiI